MGWNNTLTIDNDAVRSELDSVNDLFLEFINRITELEEEVENLETENTKLKDEIKELE